jgi:hypothetical protein
VDPGALVSRFIPGAQEIHGIGSRKGEKKMSHRAGVVVGVGDGGYQSVVSKGEKSMTEVRRTGGLLLADSVVPWKWQAAETSASSKKKILDHPCRGSRTGIKWRWSTLKPLKADLMLMSSDLDLISLIAT